MRLAKPTWVAIVVAFITLFALAPLTAGAEWVPTDPPPPNYPPTTGNG